MMGTFSTFVRKLAENSYNKHSKGSLHLLDEKLIIMEENVTCVSNTSLKSNRISELLYLYI